MQHTLWEIVELNLMLDERMQHARDAEREAELEMMETEALHGG